MSVRSVGTDADPTRAPQPATILRQIVAARLARAAPYFVYLIVIAATIPWRSDYYYSGGVDSVVLAKGIMSLLALALAVTIGIGRPPQPVVAYPLIFLLLYLACTVLGALADGNLVASAVIAARVLLLAVTVIVLAQRFPGEQLLGSAIAALATIGAVGALTGIGGQSARLSGAFPPLHPNELSSICAVTIMWCLARIITAKDTWLHLLGAGAAGLALVATGSRSAMAALVVAGAVLILHARSLRMRTILLALLALPIATWVVAGTNLITSLAMRNSDAASLTTLSNRTIAWQVALAPKSTPWLDWLGGGLSMKQVTVPGQWWSVQILDSSWISAIVQAGFVGVVICAVWVIVSIVRLLTAGGQPRGLQVSLVVYFSVRGVLESGLFDATTAFLLFLTALMATPCGTARGLGPCPLDHLHEKS